MVSSGSTAAAPAVVESEVAAAVAVEQGSAAGVVVDMGMEVVSARMLPPAVDSRTVARMHCLGAVSGYTLGVVAIRVTHTAARCSGSSFAGHDLPIQEWYVVIGMVAVYYHTCRRSRRTTARPDVSEPSHFQNIPPIADFSLQMQQPHPSFYKIYQYTVSTHRSGMHLGSV